MRSKYLIVMFALVLLSVPPSAEPVLPSPKQETKLLQKRVNHDTKKRLNVERQISLDVSRKSHTALIETERHEEEHRAEMEEQERLAAARAAQEASEEAVEQAEEPPVTRQERKPQPARAATWDALAVCESGGDWSINTGNGYSGGLQFHPQTWTSHGGREFAPYAYQATREQQIAIAEKVLASQGWGAWPSCSKQLGLR